MATSTELEALLKRLPDLDPDGAAILKAAGLGDKPDNAEAMAAIRKARPDLALLQTRPLTGKLTGPPYAEAEMIFEDALKGGKNTLSGLIAMLKEVDDGADWKVRYLLHGLVVYVMRPGKEEPRGILIDAILAGLDGKPKAIQAFLVQELDAVGDERVAAAMGKLLTDDELWALAGRTLVDVGGKAAVEQFCAALPAAKGRAKVSIVQNLGVLRDAGSWEALKQAAADSDADVRIAAVWGLANMGDRSAVDAVLKAADAPEGWERIQAAKACLVLAEKLKAAGKKEDAARICKYLTDSRKEESDWYLRNAAQKLMSAAN